MKTFKANLLSAAISFSLCMGLLTFSHCSSSDEEGTEPCSEFQCLNGGEKIVGVDQCQCDCADGYSGANCETPVIECPVNIECPIGKSPNPANDCKCE